MAVPTDPIARRKWNDDFEKKLAMLYPERGHVKNLFRSAPSFVQVAKSAIANGTVAREITIRMTELCTLQRDLSAAGVQYLGGHDLEATWNGTTDSKKQEIARQAMYRSCGVDGFENFRTFCPEMTAKTLSRRFIPLLKVFTGENAKRKEDPPYDTPIHIDNDKYDQYMKPPATYADSIEPFLRLQRIYRTYCITLTLWYMIVHFYGINEQTVLVRPGHLKSGEGRRMIKEMVKDLPRENAQEMKRMYSELREGKTECFNQICRKRPEEGRKLMSCSQCNKNGLRTYYCSRECQREDWHKCHRKLCGVATRMAPLEPEHKVDVPSVPAMDDFLKTGIPKIISPFTRSPALLHQISFLTRPGNKCDYFLMQPDPQPDVGIYLPSEVRVIFHTMRYRAMSTGNPRSVYALYKVLKLYNERTGTSNATTREQLYREYGVQIDDKDEIEDYPSTGADLTDAELREIFTFLASTDEGRS